MSVIEARLWCLEQKVLPVVHRDALLVDRGKRRAVIHNNHEEVRNAQDVWKHACDLLPSASTASSILEKGIAILIGLPAKQL